MARKETGNLHRRVLKYGYQGSLTDKNSNRINGLGRTISIPRLPNENNYAIPAPDCIVPVDSAFPVFTYALAIKVQVLPIKETIVPFRMGFPFESILSEADIVQRNYGRHIGILYSKIRVIAGKKNIFYSLFSF